MDQFEEFGSGLLLGRIDILIAVHDVDIDRQFFRVRREGPVAFGDFRIALRPEIPDRGRIFDQERETCLSSSGRTRPASAPMASFMPASKRSST